MSPRALSLLAALSMLAALAGVVVIAGWTQLNAYLVPARPRQGGDRRGAAARRRSRADHRSLRDAGVIEHPWLFRLAVRASGRDRDLKAGEYAFPAAIPARSVINMLAHGQTVARRLTVAEGLTVAEVYQLLEEAAGLTGELPPPPPEGSLLPETYFYAFGDPRAELVRRMQRAMDDVLAELWPRRAKDLPLDGRAEALTLASIVDKETASAAERAEGRRGVRQPPAPRDAAAGRSDGDLRPDRRRRTARAQPDPARLGRTTATTTPTASTACRRGRSPIRGARRSRRCSTRPRSTTCTSSPTAAAGTPSRGPWTSTTATSRCGARSRTASTRGPWSRRRRSRSRPAEPPRGARGAG